MRCSAQRDAWSRKEHCGLSPTCEVLLSSCSIDHREHQTPTIASISPPTCLQAMDNAPRGDGSEMEGQAELVCCVRVPCQPRHTSSAHATPPSARVCCMNGAVRNAAKSVWVLVFSRNQLHIRYSVGYIRLNIKVASPLPQPSPVVL
jgi:hypothetical protein